MVVQDCLRRVIKGVGGFSHAEWRSFQNEHIVADCRSFVDGDLIEQFLDLKRESMERIAKVQACSAPGQIRLLELWHITMLVMSYLRYKQYACTQHLHCGSACSCSWL